MDRDEFIREMRRDYRLEPGVYEKILDASIKSRDWTEQSMIIMEELAELSHAVSKGARGEPDRYNLILEMADVVSCLDMLRIHYGITYEELESALAVKSVYIGKKLGVIGGEGEESSQLNKVMAKRWGTKTPEAPSEIIMINRLRVFCANRESCIGCPLHNDFCWGKDLLNRRLGLFKVSTADLYRMYRVMNKSEREEEK